MTDHYDKNASRPGFGTRVIHAGQSPDPSTGAVMPPIYANSTYVQESPGVHKGLDYGRSHNPTRWALERCVADLESGGAAFAFASGLAAIATVLELLDSGAHVIAGDDLYGGTYRLLEGVRKRSAALSCSFVDLSDPAALVRCDPSRKSHAAGGNADQSAAAPGGPAGTRHPRPPARPARGGRQHALPARGYSGRWNSASTSSSIRVPSISTATRT
jgi:hypothetical protein